MFSLQHYKLPMHPAYDDDEWALMRPQRYLVLRTGERDEHGDFKKVSVTLPSEKDYDAHLKGQAVVPPGGEIRGVQPEIVPLQLQIVPLEPLECAAEDLPDAPLGEPSGEGGSSSDAVPPP